MQNLQIKSFKKPMNRFSFSKVEYFYPATSLKNEILYMYCSRNFRKTSKHLLSGTSFTGGFCKKR